MLIDFKAREIFAMKIGQNLFRGGVIPLQHGQVPARPSHRSIGIKAGWNFLQDFSAGGGVAVSKHFLVSEADPGRSRIWRNLQRAIVTRSHADPIPHQKVIEGSMYNGKKITRIEVLGAIIGCERFTPPSLSAINPTDVPKNVWLIG